MNYDQENGWEPNWEFDSGPSKPIRMGV